RTRRPGPEPTGLRPSGWRWWSLRFLPLPYRFVRLFKLNALAGFTRFVVAVMDDEHLPMSAMRCGILLQPVEPFVDRARGRSCVAIYQDLAIRIGDDVGFVSSVDREPVLEMFH